MKTVCIHLILATILIVSSSIHAVDRSEFDNLKPVKDSAVIMEAKIFAPKMWEKAIKAFNKANDAILRNKKQKSLDKHVNETREFLENAIKTTEVSKLTLQEYLPPRNKAKEAKASMLANALYKKAEAQFIKATSKVESGDVKGALKEAGKAIPLFDAAELKAIQIEIMGNADKLIKKAIADEADKFALSTLDKANSARANANAIIRNDRYNKDEATIEAKRAEYEALHASNIAMSVRSLNRNDQAWEKLMLIYEIQMNRVGKTMNFEHLPFDNGPLAAADTLILLIGELQEENKILKESGQDFSAVMINKLSKIVERFYESSTETDPARLAKMIDQHLSELYLQKEEYLVQLKSYDEELMLLSSQHESVSAELLSRTEKEEKFKKAKSMINPSEGEVLFNSSNDIVLRLSGLSFAIGKSDIQDDHVELLEKIKEIIQMFPDVSLMIEGHTDASGDASANILLSEKRAYSIEQYLRQSLLIPVDKIRSMGFGADRPVASNQTKDGRSKNRRIDIIIMQ